MNADPAEDRSTHPRRMRNGQNGRDPATERITHDVGALYLEMIEQCPHVLRHEAAVIGGRIVELGRRAMAAIVERDDAAARTCKRRYPAGIDPVHFLVGSEAMDEGDRLALPFVEIGDLDLTMREMRHLSIRYSNRTAFSRAVGKSAVLMEPQRAGAIATDFRVTFWVTLAQPPSRASHGHILLKPASFKRALLS